MSHPRKIQYYIIENSTDERLAEIKDKLKEYLRILFKSMLFFKYIKALWILNENKIHAHKY